MKKYISRISLILLLLVSLITFSACGKEPQQYSFILTGVDIQAEKTSFDGDLLAVQISTVESHNEQTNFMHVPYFAYKYNYKSSGGWRTAKHKYYSFAKSEIEIVINLTIQQGTQVSIVYEFATMYIENSKIYFYNNGSKQNFYLTSTNEKIGSNLLIYFSTENNGI